MKTTQYVQNLKCGGCANTIRKNLELLPGISEVIVNDEDSSVTFDFENQEAYETAHHKLIALGYPLAEDANSFMTKAKSFVSCAAGRMGSTSQ
ncbi:heavy-metal-associated domain-containing protein [Aureitalea sp. L0-47]|uniref:heavy-metal-associated domain-containing protein n=1 Tax=Aureitalea sp. L0-47 TaxID=2816962 RepID=UPI002237C38B|nr:heavy metal-associated domain-containing protein [Aureitalea sp. L0-47]MCW5520087.1 heavy-metal-associated domain-containing protein [Aureitalea sp. L0-47]